jgi:membrane-anchored protein YejM (alkaline phosphatase superfamily)
VVEAVQALNRLEAASGEDPEVATRISQYEMAFRMQTSVPGLMDVSGEPKEVLDLYGTRGGDGSFAANCLLARRLAERGVRFIQLYHRDWDHHGRVKRDVEITAREVDQGAAALLKDLKRRGMLDETLVIWGGEFGRTPMAQGDGRDHHIKGFSMWLAGGGIKGGLTYGATDELGYNAVENVVEVHDLHATMLHLLGVDHKRLTYKFQGRDFRLTDVHGNVVKGVLA